MAYRSWLSLHLIACACASFVSLTVNGIVDIFTRIFAWPMRWHEYAPDVSSRLHLDRVAHDLSIEPQQRIRRGRSFLERAGLHGLFTGGGFAEPQAVGTA